MLETCFLGNLCRRFLLITGKSDNCLHYANIMSIVGICSNGLRKNSKSNETRVVAQSSQGRWIFFLELELFFILKICLREIPEIYFISFSLFNFKASITHFSIDFTTLKSLIQKEFAIFLFLKSTGSIYKILRSQTTTQKLNWQSHSLWPTPLKVLC